LPGSHVGQFVLRIEDTDQNRYVEGAEKYISDCLQWVDCNLTKVQDKPGPYAPYRQSERKNIPALR
jgi:glutamyl-tRNA synthetase